MMQKFCFVGCKEVTVKEFNPLVRTRDRFSHSARQLFVKFSYLLRF